MIFNYIMNIKFDLVSNKYLALNKINLKYKNLRKWYHTYIRKALVMRWSISFGCYYNEEQEKDNGKFFVTDIKIYLNEMIKMCRFREANRLYTSILNYYLK